MSPARLLVAAVALAVALTGCGDDPSHEAVVELDATPLDRGAETVASPTLDSTGTPSPEPTPAASASAREATDTDRGRFAQAYRPEGASDLEFVAADVDGDGSKELVFVYVDSARGRVRLDVAWWDGFEYRVGASEEGGPAIRIERSRVSDVNGDERVEIATFQSTSERSSLSLWQVPTDRQALLPLVARGGCADGSHTYGAVGARFTDDDGDGIEEIDATCNEAPLPVSEWRTDRYQWQDGAYRHAPPPEPSPDPSPSRPADDDDDDD